MNKKSIVPIPADVPPMGDMTFYHVKGNEYRIVDNHTGEEREVRDMGEIWLFQEAAGSRTMLSYPKQAAIDQANARAEALRQNPSGWSGDRNSWVCEDNTPQCLASRKPTTARTTSVEFPTSVIAIIVVSIGLAIAAIIYMGSW